jgi:shikimate dehydrogenase
MKLSGSTTPFAVLGHPIGHTLSPVMHNSAFKALEMDAVYLAFDVAPEKLSGVLPAMADMGFGGVNLTVPLKETAFRDLEHMDESARRLGAVNTVEFTNEGSIIGHNTDGEGFVMAVKEAFGESVSGDRVLILGCGGAGRAVAITCAAENCSELMLTDVDGARTERLAEELAEISPDIPVHTIAPDKDAWAEAGGRSDIVVQATPVGMKETDEPLLPSSAFHPGQVVFDLIYMYPETAFMKAALEAGASASNGLAMLLYQGAKAFNIWTRREPAVQAMRTALEAEVYA